MSLFKIRKQSPLVYCITNTVAANFTANGLLAIGASPLMSDEVAEARELIDIASALLINIGTVHEATAKAMLVAGKAANEKGIPVILDPVGVGASSYRQQVVEEILQQVDVQCIRCNVGELAANAGVHWKSRGVDSGDGEIDVIEVAKLIANAYNTIVFVTGSTDVITNGREVMEVAGGDKRITEVTATGCLLSAICAAALTTAEEPMNVLSNTAKDYKQVATIASQHQQIGHFQYELLNALQQLSKGE
ncbi:MAG: hydroxyethylthiazole kinase [Lysinibacillus sp.]